jgi:hypothetical protein
MRLVFLVTAAGLAAGLALAGPEILPISGTGYLIYDEATGKVSQQTGWTRFGHSVWAATDMTGQFLRVSPPENVLDWGDIACPVSIGGFGFASYTNSRDADGDLYAVISVYAEENGWNSTDRVYVGGFVIDNIPASTYPPNEYWGYAWRVELTTPLLVLDGSDIDGDGLTDFGYRLFFSVRTPGAVHGPAIAIADPEDAPGADEWYDLFLEEDYVGTYSLGADRQIYWEISAPSCPNPGDSGWYCLADIDGSFDCTVGLADLSMLLSNYGMTAGATPLMGDIDPYDEFFPGDGDVDLGDLSEMLSQYGDDCS